MRPNWYPARFRRQEPHISPDNLVYGLMGINALVFMAWKRGEYRYQKGDPRALRFMAENFTSSSQGLLMQGRLHTALTSMFSHRSMDHFLFNMLTLWSFGPGMAAMLGIRRFLAVYLGGGITSSLTSAVFHKVRGGDQVQSLGASGGLMSMLTTFALLRPNHTILLMFIPVPAKLAVFGYAAYDFYMASGRNRSRTDHIGHLGGAAFGLGYTLTRLL